MKSIITIQHTQSAHHLTGMVGSWTDWELTELGRAHAENIGRRLSAELAGKGYKIYSSDLARARQTAEPLARYLGLEIEFNKKLREQNAGEAVGKSSAWVKEHARPANSFDDREFVGAESWREMWTRVTELRDEVISDPADNIVLVSHGVTLSVWQPVWLGEEISGFKYAGLPGGVSFMEIDGDGARTIARLNDPSYMQD